MCGLVIDIDQKYAKAQQIDYLSFKSALIIPFTSQCFLDLIQFFCKKHHTECLEINKNINLLARSPYWKEELDSRGDGVFLQKKKCRTI